MDGSLAIDRPGVAPYPNDLPVNESAGLDSTRRGRVGTVPRMRPAPRAPLPSRRRPDVRRARRRAILLALGLGLTIVALLSAFATGAPPTVGSAVPASASRLLPAGPPQPLVVAVSGALRLQLPINEQNVTAIGYHGAGDDVLALDPLGRQANEGLFSRLFHRIFGGGGGGIAYYRLGGGVGPSTGALNVGAVPGTDVYSPVDGTVVGVRPYIVNGRAYGSRVEIQPAGEPSVVVSVTHISVDPSLTVGAALAAGTTKIGTVIDLASVERQTLARYTQDAGNHVSIEVRPAANAALG